MFLNHNVLPVAICPGILDYIELLAMSWCLENQPGKAVWHFRPKQHFVREVSHGFQFHQLHQLQSSIEGIQCQLSCTILIWKKLLSHEEPVPNIWLYLLVVFSPKAKTEKPHNISWPNATYSWLAGGSKECQRHSRVEPCRPKPNAMQWPTRERRRCAGPQLVHRMVHGWHNVNCQMENREFYKHFINIQMSNVWTWCSPHGWMTWRHKSVVPQWHSNFLPNGHLPSNLSSKSDT